MSLETATPPEPRDPYTFRIGAVAPAQPAGVPPEFPPVHPTTGTEDDDDDPADERPDENEASERETDERTEAPEEFEYDDEDRTADSPVPDGGTVSGTRRVRE
jgi:hypothetical protein